MGQVDGYDGLVVSAAVTAGRVALVAVHEPKAAKDLDDFFGDVYELYCKALLNPLYVVGAPITSLAFAESVKRLSRRHFQ